MDEEREKYELSVHPGSGWMGANWLIVLRVPAYDKWPTSWVTLRHFETEEQARDEAAKMVVDIVQSSTERR